MPNVNHRLLLALALLCAPVGTAQAQQAPAAQEVPANTGSTDASLQAAGEPTAVPAQVLPGGAFWAVTPAEAERAYPRSEFRLGLAAEPRVLDRDIMAPVGSPIGQFVLPQLSFVYDLESQLKLPDAGEYGYLFTGLFRVDHVGAHDFVGVATVPDTGGYCGMRLTIAGSVIFEKERGERRESFTFSASGRGMLEVGLHPISFWVACRVYDKAGTTISLRLKAPSDAEFQVAPIERFAHTLH